MRQAGDLLRAAQSTANAALGAAAAFQARAEEAADQLEDMKGEIAQYKDGSVVDTKLLRRRSFCLARLVFRLQGVRGRGEHGLAVPDAPGGRVGDAEPLGHFV